MKTVEIIEAVKKEFPGILVINVWDNESEEFENQWLCECTFSKTYSRNGGKDSFEVIVTLQDGEVFVERQ